MIHNILYHLRLILHYTPIDKENSNLYHQLQTNQMQKKLHYVTNVVIIYLLKAITKQQTKINSLVFICKVFIK